MRDALLIRHGKTRGNIEGRYIGRTDEPVCEPITLDIAPQEGNVRLFVSPMLRCVQTATALFPGVAQTVLPGLRECDFGIFEGKTAGELESCPEYAAWLDTDCTGDIPGGESVSGFKERCSRVFLGIAETDCETAVIVTHGGVIMSILERFGWPRRKFYDYYLPNCGYFLCRWDGERLI